MHSPTATLTAARNRPQFGFTAIELMVVVSIVAVLAALAGPSFTPLSGGVVSAVPLKIWRSTLYFARSEANAVVASLLTHLGLEFRLESYPYAGQHHNGLAIEPQT